MGGGTDSRLAAPSAPRHPYVWVAATMIVLSLEEPSGHPRRWLGSNPHLLVRFTAVPGPSHLLQLVPTRSRCAVSANIREPLLGCA